MSRCPGDPAGHHWHLDEESVWYRHKPGPRRPMTWKTWLWYTIGTLMVFPIGAVLMDNAERRAKYGYDVRIGVRRRWYCELCRAFEITEHLDGS